MIKKMPEEAVAHLMMKVAFPEMDEQVVANYVRKYGLKGIKKLTGKITAYRVSYLRKMGKISDNVEMVLAVLNDKKQDLIKH